MAVRQRGPAVARRPGADVAFKLAFSKARRRKPSNRTDFDPVVVTLAEDMWMVEPANERRAAAAKSKLSSEAETLRREILNLLAAGQGEMRKPLDDMPKMPTLARKTLQAGLIKTGWLRVSDGVSEDDAPPKPEQTRLWKRLTTLKAAGIVGFNRDDVWLAERSSSL